MRTGISAKVGTLDVRYDEDDDEWSCSKLEMSAKSLRALRQRINAHDADMRRVDKVKVVILGTYEVRPAVITLIEDDSYCWVTDKHGRGKHSFRDIALDTPEVAAAIAAHKKLLAVANRAEKAAEKALAAIPRVTRAQLMELKVAKAEAES